MDETPKELVERAKRELRNLNALVGALCVKFGGDARKIELDALDLVNVPRKSRVCRYTTSWGTHVFVLEEPRE